MLAATTYGMQERFMEREAIEVQAPIAQQEEIAQPVKQQAAPQQIAQRDPEQQKAIKTLASFLTTKRLVKKLHGFFMRSAKPTKELLRSFFFYCDFHKDQLVKLKECMHERAKLIQQAIPISAHTGFYLLESPQMKKIMELMHKGQTIEDDEPRAIDLEAVEKQLAQDNPTLHAQLQDLKKQLELFDKKWKPFFETLIPYIQARVQLHREALEKDAQSFMISLIWRNLGPALGLGIEGYTKIKNIDFQDEQVMRDLVKEILDNALANRAELEATMIECAQETATVYGDIFNAAIKEAMKRVP
jgi:hypothetical protein